MKAKINRITIEAEFTTLQELRQMLLGEVVERYSIGHKEHRSSFVKWLSYPTDEVREVKHTVGSFNGVPFHFEDIDGDTYLIIESSLNRKKD